MIGFPRVKSIDDHAIQRGNDDKYCYRFVHGVAMDCGDHCQSRNHQLILQIAFLIVVPGSDPIISSTIALEDSNLF